MWLPCSSKAHDGGFFGLGVGHIPDAGRGEVQSEAKLAAAFGLLLLVAIAQGDNLFSQQANAFSVTNWPVTCLGVHLCPG